MKLMKFLAVIFFSVTLLFTSGCAVNFCSAEDEAAIKEAIKTQIVENTGEGVYAQPADWFEMSEEEQTKYIDKLYSKNHPKSCLTTEDKVDPVTGVTIEGKNWGFAFSRGLIEGVLVYPISMLLIFLSNLFGGTGFAKMLAIIIATIIIRLITLAATFKSTMQTQKMQMIQPEMAAIQAKYAGQTDPATRNKMAMEQMKVYEKYGINPMKSLISPFLTLPIFIAVWGSVNSTMMLREGEVFGVQLSQTLSSGIVSFNLFAILLLILMIGFQYASMKLPNWLNKKKISRLDANEKRQLNQNNTMTYMMMVMIVFMGLALPIAVSIYWVSSSLVSIIQTFIVKKVGG